MRNGKYEPRSSNGLDMMSNEEAVQKDKTFEDMFDCMGYPDRHRHIMTDSRKVMSVKMIGDSRNHDSEMDGSRGVLILFHPCILGKSRRPKWRPSLTLLQFAPSDMQTQAKDGNATTWTQNQCRDTKRKITTYEIIFI
ncbi:hypothetical protein TWF730_011256 [Orbilia blumenaviensis]|uniref:Uncharacterized protein n=1 Tax=Orbilia blumenaviensis TaxID=1796055 RepID=A0AAV9UK55_9PEZI